ncbi:MAG: DUF3592 domain-containing protein [Oscillospiraceae bacterium]
MKKKKIVYNIIGILVILLGIFILIYGISAAIYANDFRKTAVTASAVITDIKTEFSTSKKNRVDSKAFVQYEVDGEIYNVQLNSYSPDMAVGDEITIIYNPENPEIMLKEFTPSGGELILGFSAFPFVIGVWILVSANRKKQKKIIPEEELEENQWEE